MSSISVRVNVGDFGATMQQWVNGLAQKVDERTQEAGINVGAGAKQACPVGTPESTHKKGYHGGRLRQSIQYANMGLAHSGVGSTVYYAGFVDGGTKFMKARPFLTNAFINERKAWKQDLQDMV